MLERGAEGAGHIFTPAPRNAGKEREIPVMAPKYRLNTLLILSALLLSLGAARDAAGSQDLIGLFQEHGIPLDTSDALDSLIEEAAARDYVLLGEASHGTSEFYTWRATISQRLIEDHGFSFIAVEGDWDACARVNAYVKQLPGAPATAEAALDGFTRWPPWMWNNEEVLELVTWLRAFNEDKPRAEQVGFYGIDVYGMDGSLDAVLAYFEEVDPEAAAEAAADYACLTPFRGDPGAYARAAAAGAACEVQSLAVFELLRAGRDRYQEEDAKAYFHAKQHAHVVKNAERHYRAMAGPRAASWNYRVRHFAETVDRLMDFHGEDAKGIVWAHNTHIGDARATGMAQQGQHNIGQLLREAHGEDAVYAVGFGTHRGEVLAGSAWGSPVQAMQTPEALPGSIEDLMHRAGLGDFLLRLPQAKRDGPLGETVAHRAIGVVYNPAQERGNYVPTRLAHRYDAFLFLEQTRPLQSRAGQG